MRCQSFTSGIFAALWFLRLCASNELTLEGSYSNPVELDQSRAIALSGIGPYAYISIDAHLAVMDISAVERLFIASLRPTATLNSDVQGIIIEPRGKYAYVSGTEFVVIYVEDIAAPSVIGSTNLGDPIWDIAVSGQYAYAVCSSSNSLRIVDVSYPTNPTMVAQVSDGGLLEGARGVALSGQYAYVAAFYAHRLTVVDISSATPRLGTSIKSTSQLGSPAKVAVAGEYAYVLATGNNAVTAVDISDPANPVIAGPLSSFTGFNAPSRITIRQSRYAYVLHSAGLTRLDILHSPSMSVDSTIDLPDGPYTDFGIKDSSAYCVKDGKMVVVGIYVTTTTTTFTQTSSTTTTSTFTLTSTTTSSSTSSTTTADPRDCASHACPEGMTHKMTFRTPKYCLRPICDMSLDADWCCDQLCSTFECSGGSTHRENAEELKCAGFCDPFIDRKLCCKYLPIVNGSVALLRSSVASRVHEVDQLVSMGVATTARSGGGSTALHFAALSGHREIVEAIIRGRADVNAADEQGWAPLHVAAGRGHLAAVDLLVHNRAIPELRTAEGKTAREIALQVAGPPGSPDRLQADAAMALSKHERAYKNEMTIKYERTYRDNVNVTTVAGQLASSEL
eukprot:TRINITY_DN26538_c0_g1_i1.p1 TRINITY_DN26538_c0_g1~~TRINITY_DN26538_c0_g1_i1.p1  ORF type:complete len:621 (-),score=67.82 TRINITY_DN26538_c0_g1_i1:111-1973(-)